MEKTKKNQFIKQNFPRGGGGGATWSLCIGHRELIICPIDSNGESLVFDSLFCISEYM